MKSTNPRFRKVGHVLTSQQQFKTALTF